MLKKSLLVAALATTASLAIANTTTTAPTAPAVKKAVHKKVAHKKAAHKKATQAGPAAIVVVAKPVMNNNASFAGINAGIGLGASSFNDRVTVNVNGATDTTSDRGASSLASAANVSYLFPISSQWILGPEAHVQYNTAVISDSHGGLRNVQTLRWNYGAAAKVGYATSQDNMFFAVVGPEWANFYSRSTGTSSGVIINNVMNPTKFGWMTGVGAEQALTTNLHISEQVNYGWFNNAANTYSIARANHNFTLTTGLVSLVYHFAS